MGKSKALDWAIFFSRHFDASLMCTTPTVIVYEY